MCKYMGIFLVTSLLAADCIAPTVRAEIFRCIAPDGSVLFSDIECGENAEVITVKPNVLGGPRPGLNFSKSLATPPASQPAPPPTLPPTPREGEQLRIVEQKDQLPTRQEQSYAARRQRIITGMTQDFVRKAWNSPDTTSQRITSNGNVVETWRYRGHGFQRDWLIFFRDGRVTSVSSVDPRTSTR